VATEAQLIQALKRADAAGATEDARKLAKALGSMRKASTPAAPAAPMADPSQGFTSARATGQAKSDAGYAGGLFSNFAQGLTAGFGDELAGSTAAVGLGFPALAAAGPLAMGLGSGETQRRYDEARDQFRDVRNDFAAENPIAATAANIAGAIPGAAMAPIRAGGSLAGRVGRGAGLGLGYGTLAGVGEGEGEAGRAIGGAIGGAVGALGGGAFEAAASWIGRLAQHFMARLGRPPQLISPTGSLTGEGRALLHRVGMNPDEATPSFLAEMQARISQRTLGATAPVEVNARRALAEGMDVPVPLNRGQMTLDPNHQGFEYDARAGNYGDLPRNAIRATDDRAEAALRANMEALQRRVAGGAEPIPYMGAGGEMVSANLEGAERGANAGVNAAYRDARANGMAAGVPRDATNELVSEMRGAISGYAPESAPAVYGMLERFGGPLERAGAGDTRISRIFDLRSQLTNAGAAGTPEQSAGRAAARAVDDFLTSALERDLISGDPAAVERWTRAVASRREYGRLFEGKDLIERLTARDRISGEHQLVTPPEKAANVILGASNLGFTNRPELARAMGTLRERLGPDSREWNALREETLLRLFQMAEGGQRAEGRGLSGAKFASAIDSFSTKNAPLWRLMFNPDEQTSIRRLAQVMKLVTTPVEGARNHSGTAAALVRGLKSVAGTPVAGRVLNWVGTHFNNIARLSEAERAAAGIVPTAPLAGNSYAGSAGSVLGAREANGGR
jgi:hypothetical protein